MVQWRTDGGACRKCGKDLNAPAAVMDAPPDIPKPQKPKTFPTRLVVTLSATAVVALMAWLVGRYVFDARGTPVGRFEDSPRLVEMEFPKGWYHLRVDHRDLPMPRYDSERFWDSIRGSFYLGKHDHPYGLFYLRIDLLGMSLGPSQTVSRDDRAGMLHAFGKGEAERLGGAYSPLAQSGDAARSWVFEELNRFQWMRVDGRISTTEPLFLWHGPGEYRMVTLYTSGSNRDYWLHVFCPEQYYSRVWPRIKAIIDGAEFVRATA